MIALFVSDNSYLSAVVLLKTFKVCNQKPGNHSTVSLSVVSASNFCLTLFFYFFLFLLSFHTSFFFSSFLFFLFFCFFFLFFLSWSALLFLPWCVFFSLLVFLFFLFLFLLLLLLLLLLHPNFLRSIYTPFQLVHPPGKGSGGRGACEEEAVHQEVEAPKDEGTARWRHVNRLEHHQ